MARRSRKRLERSSARTRRLERRRAERERIAALYHEDEGRIVCARCGLEQPFRSSPRADRLAPCEGALGIACASEYAITIEAYLEQTDQ